MATKEERLREQMEKERRDRDTTQLLVEEERRKAAAALAALEDTSPKPKPDESSFKLKAGNDDWKKIRIDYMKLHPDQPIKDDTLVFATREDAIKFFTEQAKSEPPRKFLCSEMDANNSPTGFNVFSCGTNKLYQGSLKEIQSQLTTDLKEKPDNLDLKQGLEQITRILNPNPTTRYRADVHQAKIPEVPHETEEEQARSSLPDPFDMKPKATRK